MSQGAKGNQAMKLGQLIEHYMRNIFLEKSHTKCGGETISRPNFKIKYISGLVVQSDIQFVFIVLQV